LQIRAATPDDAEAIGEILEAAGIAAWGEFLGRERIVLANMGYDHPAELVALDDDGVAGFVAWDEATGEVTRLYTHPRAWGRGLGTALLDRALEALRVAGHAQAWLYTEERNERGVRFYENRGWRVEGEPRRRDWHGARLFEPRYVKDL
jgi:ribosomal protein S18 acetylase RimI-like enzyme